MLPIVRTLRNRFEADRVLRVMGRRLYLSGEEIDVLPRVVVAPSQTETLNTADANDDYGRWSLLFTCQTKASKTVDKIMRLAESIVRVFEAEPQPFGGDGCHVSVIRSSIGTPERIPGRRLSWQVEVSLTAYIEMNKAVSYGT